MNIKERTLDLIKNNYAIVSVLTIILGLAISFFAGDVEFDTKNVTMLNENNLPITKQIVYTKHIYTVLNLVSNGSIPFGITLFITMFFVTTYEKKNSDAMKRDMYALQKDTARNAVYSIFQTIIDEAFFDVIKNDVLNCKIIRSNAKWIYDISENADKLVLVRTISYSLKNLSPENQKEIVEISAFSNKYLESKVTMLKYKTSEENRFVDLLADGGDDGKSDLKKEIPIEKEQSVEIVKQIRQTFSTEYIYETHFANCPLTNLELEVNLPSNYDFKLSYAALSQRPEIALDEQKKKIYRFKRAILKGQGIEFFLQKK